LINLYDSLDYAELFASIDKIKPTGPFRIQAKVDWCSWEKNRKPNPASLREGSIFEKIFPRNFGTGIAYLKGKYNASSGF